MKWKPKVKPLIINLEPEGYSDKAVLMLSEYFDYRVIQPHYPLGEQISDAIGIITRLAYRIDYDFLAQAKKIKFIATATTGLNHIAEGLDLEIISLKGERDFLNKITPTAEHTWGLIIALARQYKKAFSSVESYFWDRDQNLGMQLFGKTIGIIGLGRLGFMVAQYAQAFGMRVLYYDIKQMNVDFREELLSSLLEKSDVVTIHLPFDSETRDFISHDELSLMKRNALLINTARGEIVNEDALLYALESGYIGGAALDVLNGEVTWKGKVPHHNKLIKYAKNNENLLITPHIGGACPDAMRMTEQFIAQKIIKYYINNI